MEFSICDGLGSTESLFTLLQIYQFPRSVLTATTTTTTGAVKAALSSTQLSSILPNGENEGRALGMCKRVCNYVPFCFAQLAWHILAQTQLTYLHTYVDYMGWWILRILKQDAAVVGTADVGCFVLLSKDGNF